MGGRFSHHKPFAPSGTLDPLPFGYPHLAPLLRAGQWGHSPGDPVLPSSHARWGPHLPVTQEDFEAACPLAL